jgi:hypothetical protein
MYIRNPYERERERKRSIPWEVSIAEVPQKIFLPARQTRAVSNFTELTRWF